LQVPGVGRGTHQKSPYLGEQKRGKGGKRLLNYKGGKPAKVSPTPTATGGEVGRGVREKKKQKTTSTKWVQKKKKVPGQQWGQN